MPTGLTDTPQVIGSPGPTPRIPQPSINREVLAILKATNVPQPIPGIRVEPGATVRIRGNNSTPTGNAGIIRVGQYRDAVAGVNTGSPITPDTEIIYPLDNLATLWFAGTEGDGVLVSVRNNSTA